MKSPSLASMSVRATTAKEPVLTASDQDVMTSSHQEGAPVPGVPVDRPKKARPPSWELAQVTLRMPAEKRRRLHQLAISLDKSAQDVLLEALDAYLDARGLRRID